MALLGQQAWSTAQSVLGQHTFGHVEGVLRRAVHQPYEDADSNVLRSLRRTLERLGLPVLTDLNLPVQLSGLAATSGPNAATPCSQAAGAAASSASSPSAAFKEFDLGVLAVPVDDVLRRSAASASPASQAAASSASVWCGLMLCTEQDYLSTTTASAAVAPSSVPTHAQNTSPASSGVTAPSSSVSAAAGFGAFRGSLQGLHGWALLRACLLRGVMGVEPLAVRQVALVQAAGDEGRCEEVVTQALTAAAATASRVV